MYLKFLSKNLCMRSQLDHTGVDMKKVLSLILKDYGVGGEDWINVAWNSDRRCPLSKGVVKSCYTKISLEGLCNLWLITFYFQFYRQFDVCDKFRIF
jgi:hypothetical protein